MQIYNENNLDTMRSMKDNSIDAIVCDPPYGISFMNLKFDYDIPSIETWKECLRVLKPGGHLLAFSSPRTYHRMASNIEDATFEIKDMISWIYGCYSEDTEVLTKRGYINYKDFKDDYILQWDTKEFSWYKPETIFEYDIEDEMVLLGEQLVTLNHTVYFKDDNITKDLTKDFAENIKEVYIPYYYPDKIVYKKEKAHRVQYNGKVWCLTTEVGAFVVRRNGKAFISGNSGFPKSLNISKALDKKAFMNWLKDNLKQEKAYNEEIKGKEDYSEITIKYKKIAGLYNVVGKQKHPTSINRTGNKSPFQAEEHLDENFEITSPVSEKAKEYEGFGTALKPAHECIVCARKPLSEKTIAENILKWGTGGINIDGCRIDHDEKTKTTNRIKEYEGPSWGKGKSQSKNHISSPSPKGRFPANIIYDGSKEVEKIFPESKGQQGDIKGTELSNKTNNIYGQYNSRQFSKKRNDTGSASRFFYCAKSSKSDRTNDGAVDNIHPTCKPTELMQYLVRLVTPPNGIVYDPFMGSGTTGKAALLEKFNFIGSEMEEKYFNIAKARLENTIIFIKDPESLIIEKKIKNIEKIMGMKSIFGKQK